MIGVSAFDLAGVALASSKRLDAASFRLLWVDDWYDGPLQAMVARGDERLLLVIHDRAVPTTDEPWRWCVARLTPAALAAAEAAHDLFAFHVGERWCSHLTPHRAHVGAPSSDRFYARQATWPPLTAADLEVIGWLDEPPAPERR